MADLYITQLELSQEPYNINEDSSYIEILQDMTKTLIDNLCGQDFEQEGSVGSYVEKKVSGNDKETIFLPKRLITLEKVRIYSSSTEYTDYLATEFTAKKKFITWDFYSTSATTLRLRVYSFPEGIYNIGVFGIWGWSAVPDPIKYLQGRLIQKLINDGSFSNKFESEKIGDYSYKLKTDSKGNKILGDDELDLIVDQYREAVTYAAK